MHDDTSRADAFQFGPRCFTTPEAESFWRQHQPVVAAWIEQMRAEGDPWWQSASHAAYCLVSHREIEAEGSEEPPHWRDFDVEYFLFHDLHEGGTVGFYGSVPIFFDQLEQAFARFVDAGIIESAPGQRWLQQLHAARPRFLAHYRGCDEH